MSESESWKLQWSVKVGNDMLNIRAESPEEFDYLLSAVEERAAAIAGLVGTLTGAGAVGKIAAPASQQPSQPQAWGSTSGQTPTAPQSTSGQGSSPTSGASAPTCQHGTKVWRAAKPESGKDWKGWFCPSPRGTVDQCKPVYVR